MKLDYLKDNKEIVSIVLLGVSAFFGVMILVKAAGFFVASARAERLVTDAVAQSKLDPNDTGKYFAKSKEIADELKKKNLFAPPPPEPGQPIREVDILGDALINGKWYKVGDKVGDATILAIEPTQIKFEWQGKEITLGPFGAKSSSDSASSEHKRPRTEKGKETEAETKKEDVDREQRRRELDTGGGEPSTRRRGERARSRARRRAMENRTRARREGANGN